MSFGYVVLSTGTEIQFVTSLVDYITGLDPRITCTTDIAAEYNDSDPTHIPVITFLIDNTIAFTLTRCYRDGTDNPHPGPLNIASNGFIINCDIFSTKAYCVRSDAVPYKNNSERAFAVSSIVTDEFILLSINGREYYYATYSTANMNIVYLKNESTYYTSIITGLSFSKSTIFNISNRTFTENSTGKIATFVSRFSYACLPGYIDYIKNSVYVNSAISPAEKQFNISTIYDCTTVVPGETTSLSDGRYIAVGPHQLVKIPDT